MNASVISINADLCRKDGICVEVCPSHIFRTGSDGVVEIVGELTSSCIKCGHCMAACPGDAITVPGLDLAEFTPTSATLPDFETLGNLVRHRRSIRCFQDKLIPLELLQKLIDLTRYCPTAKNSQNLSWLVVSGADKVRQVAGDCIDVFREVERMASLVAAFDHGDDPICRQAPHLLLIYGPRRYQWGGFDAAIAITALELAAQTCGLGTCWGGFVTTAAGTDKQIGQRLGVPANDQIYAALMIGYPKHTYRKTPARAPLRLKSVEG